MMKKKNTLLSTSFSKIEWSSKHGFITLQLIKNDGVTYDQLLEVQKTFALLVEEHNAKKVLVDSRSFSLDVPEEYTDWLTIHVDSTFRKVGVEKMATLVKDRIYQFFQNAEFDFGGIKRRVFINEISAIRWLIKKEQYDTSRVDRFSLRS